jgi:hypothetical protein
VWVLLSVDMLYYFKYWVITVYQLISFISFICKIFLIKRYMQYFSILCSFYDIHGAGDVAIYVSCV